MYLWNLQILLEQMSGKTKNGNGAKDEMRQVSWPELNAATQTLYTPTVSKVWSSTHSLLTPSDTSSTLQRKIMSPGCDNISMHITATFFAMCDTTKYLINSCIITAVFTAKYFVVVPVQITQITRKIWCKHVLTDAQLALEARNDFYQLPNSTI